jgi:hypothetical protein
MNTISFTTLSINAALKAAAEFLHSEVHWNAKNETQKRFLSEFYDDSPGEWEFVKRRASKSIIDIKEFFSQNGFPHIYLDPLGPGEFAIAGVLDHIMTWAVAGKSSILSGKDNNEYAAVDFCDEGWQVFSYRGHSHPVAVISTKSSDSVYLTFPEKEPKSTIAQLFDMVTFAQALTKKRGIERHYDHLIIPKIKYEGDIDATWIEGLQTVDNDEMVWEIRNATMKSRLRLNHLGARAQAAVGGFLLDAPPKYLVFDRPFLIWFVYGKKVTYVAYVTEEHWKDPGDEIFN